TDVKVDSYESAGQVELLSYRNDTNKDQTYMTPEKSLKTSESFTYSNHVGVKLGVASESKVKAEIPFLG
ncbi:hypothetical protein CN488_31515, partial [Bacillus anthracis]